MFDWLVNLCLFAPLITNILLDLDILLDLATDNYEFIECL